MTQSKSHSPSSLKGKVRTNNMNVPRIEPRTSLQEETLPWKEFEELLKSKQIYISKPPDSQDRYTFTRNGIQLMHQVRKKKDGNVGAGYFSVAFDDVNTQYFVYKRVKYQLDKAKHINIQNTIENGHFMDLLLETYKRKTQ